MINKRILTLVMLGIIKQFQPNGNLYALDNLDTTQFYNATSEASIDGMILPSEQNVITVAAMKFDSAYEGDFDNVYRKIENLLKEYEDISLIVTPEALFYDELDADIWIKTRENGEHYEVYEASSSELMTFVESMQELADKYDTNIILGTFGELVDSEEPVGDYMYNTQLIIDKEGQIKVHRKYSEFIQGRVPVKPINRVSSEPQEYTLSTMESIELESKNGISFTVLPLICKERHYGGKFPSLENANADIVAISQSEGDDLYDWLSEYRHRGSVDDSNRFNTRNYHNVDYQNEYWAELVEDYKKNGVIKQESFILASDMMGGQAGVLSAGGKIAGLTLTEDYVLGRVCLGRD